MEYPDILAGAHVPGESWANLGLGTGPSRGGVRAVHRWNPFPIRERVGGGGLVPTGEAPTMVTLESSATHRPRASRCPASTARRILTAYQARLVIWNYKTQTRMMEREFHPGFAHSLRNFSSRVFVSSVSFSSRVFVSSVRFIVKSTEQLFVVGDEDGYIHVHNCMTMKRVKEFKAHGCAVTSFAVHPTQPFVLSASRDQLIKLWNWEKGWVCIRTFTGHSARVNQVKFNPHDNNTFASASGDGTVKIWRIFSPTHFTSLNCEEGQRSVDYYPTGGDQQQQQHYMVTGSGWQLRPDNATARIWDLRTQTCTREIKGLNSYCEVGVIDCHPDRPAVLVTASGSCGVSLHDSTTYRCERTVHFGLGKVVCVAYVKGIRRFRHCWPHRRFHPRSSLPLPALAHRCCHLLKRMTKQEEDVDIVGGVFPLTITSAPELVEEEDEYMDICNSNSACDCSSGCSDSNSSSDCCNSYSDESVDNTAPAKRTRTDRPW
ncbi:putative coatomer subunit beta'-3 [Triticum aestivum]|uniref:putative coatomer subunit beta'-3 n=1 Tax=Triticum aestivum TaxID=4565 RepID=UPI001D01744C|nr:putative coatomer subunit beta'-3 [Triticum aestivum]